MMKRKLLFATVLVLVALLLALPLAGCGGTGGSGDEQQKVETGAEQLSGQPPYKPIFLDPQAKLDQTADPQFTDELYEQALAYEPLLEKQGTQVYEGFWSGKGNHGSLVRVLDAINDYKPAAGAPAQKAIWDEGATSSNQYPAYVDMLEEQWYARAYPKDGKVTIYGHEYEDPQPVTPEQADEIWGRYSQRYADMAKLIRKATGNPVKAMCFVQGAKAGRVFYKYELPQLKALEQSGDVLVYFAKNIDADWQNPADWTEGTASAPPPAH